MEQDRQRLLSKKVVVKHTNLATHKRFHLPGEPAYDYACFSTEKKFCSKSVCGGRASSSGTSSNRVKATITTVEQCSRGKQPPCESVSVVEMGEMVCDVILCNFCLNGM